MNIILNKLNGSIVNDVEYLDTMGKHAILQAIRGHLATPAKIVIALACDVDEMTKQLTPAKDLLTLGEWLDELNIELDTTEKHRLANLVSRLYKKEKQTNPRKIARQDSRGRYLKKSYGFDEGEIYILEMALEELKTMRSTITHKVPQSSQ